MSQPRTIARLSLPCALLATTTALAQATAAAPETTSFFGEIVSIVVPLAFIILVLLAVLHLARRRYGATGQDATLSVVQILPLGPRERIVLLKTRTGRLFAVGVTAQSVRLITDLDPAELVATRSAPEADIAGPSTVFGRPLIPRDLFGRRAPGANGHEA